MLTYEEMIHAEYLVMLMQIMYYFHVFYILQKIILINVVNFLRSTAQKML